MPIPETLSTDPHCIADPDDRWQPGGDGDEQRLERLLPPLVDGIRRAVAAWRNDGYAGVSETTRALLAWWFERGTDSPHIRYYFSQREAVESVIYLYEAAKVKDKVDLLRFDATGEVNQQMMPETWKRYVIKMATGSGKTKVISLLIAWSYFHKRYEAGSALSRNILLIAPNIIVLDRLHRDFDNLSIFRDDAVLPPNGYGGRDWHNDFDMRLHRQNEVRTRRRTGNIFLTNIHRVYVRDNKPPSPDDDDTRDYFLGAAAVDPTDNRIDLGEVVRDLDELLVVNDEAHHIHDPRMAWAGAVADLHNTLVQKDRELSLQIDVTATPKHNNGTIFVQTVADYPLVEAIHQNVVKRPVIPDGESADKLTEIQSTDYGERYKDYIDLGVREWRKARAEHKKAGKKAVLFLMTDDTKNCDALGQYLESHYGDLKEQVLVIHTQANGEITEKATGGKALKELDELRRQSAGIDEWDNPYCAVVSVLVLREGWDVRNVTTIVGLRAYSSGSNILPEQTLGRGLRLMYPDDDAGEKVSVIGSPAFVEFVREIEKEGVKLEKVAMGRGTAANAPLIIAVDHDNKNIAELDITMPILSRLTFSDYTKLQALKSEDIVCEVQEYKTFSEDAPRTIVFQDVLTGEVSHTTTLSSNLVDDYSRVIGYFTRRVMHKNRLFSQYSFLYAVMQDFVRDRLFGKTVELESADTIRNLAEVPVSKAIAESFDEAIKKLLTQKNPQAGKQGELKVSDMRPFPMKPPKYRFASAKCPQNFVAENFALEIDFAEFLDKCSDVAAFAKNYFAVNFRLDYVKADGAIAAYFPDFLVRTGGGEVWVVETKGRADENDLRKYARLQQWCRDVREFAPEYAVGSLFIDEVKFRAHTPKTFADLIKMFRDKN